MELPEDKILFAYLETLREAILRARYLAFQEGKWEEISDILDAVHNIPRILMQWNAGDRDFLLHQIEAYDKKWSSDSQVSLNRVYLKKLAEFEKIPTVKPDNNEEEYQEDL